jgi:hypothetical protein
MPNIVFYIATSVDGYIPPNDSQKQAATHDLRNLQERGRTVNLPGQRRDRLNRDELS